jgi:uncharacterized membrane protein
MINFFNKEEEARIIEAIRQAELDTSGEVRVHIEADLKKPILDEAIRTFGRLNMHRTEARNGVLIFLAPQKRELAIVGDEGINAVVPPNFWDEEKNLMVSYFRKGEYCEGVVQAIAQVGQKLREFFPYHSEDVNELPDDISYS